MTYTEREIWTTGRRGSVVCVQVAIYPHNIVGTTERENITERQFIKALNREFPQHTFYLNDTAGKWYWRADADRWTGDGVVEIGPTESGPFTALDDEYAGVVDD